MAKVCNSKILNHKLYESNHRAMLINNTYNDSQKGLRSSISFMDSKWLGKSKIEYRDILVFSNFVETSKKALNLVMYLFDYPSLLTFWVTSFFWMTLTKGPQKTAMKNTTKVKSLVYFFKKLYNSTYIFPKSCTKPANPPCHFSRRVLRILYLHIIDMWGAK